MRLKIPSSLHYRKFRLLWLGQLISSAGSDMQTWALFWHIRDLTEAPIALGAVGLARLVPIVVFSLIGGSIADAFNRKTIPLYHAKHHGFDSIYLSVFDSDG